MGYLSTGPGILRYWYVTDGSGYPNRGAAAFSFPAVVFAAAFIPVLLLESLLLGLVFVELASERGRGTAGTATRHRTRTEWLWSIKQLAHVVCCLIIVDAQEQLNLTHVHLTVE